MNYYLVPHSQGWAITTSIKKKPIIVYQTRRAGEKSLNSLVKLMSGLVDGLICDGTGRVIDRIRFIKNEI